MGEVARLTVRPEKPISVVPLMLRAAHPLPAAAVTVFAVALAAAAGNSATKCLILGLAVGCGQLSIGWSNDLLDQARDRAVGRSDKPLAQGQLAARVAMLATVVAVLATIGLSLALGWRAGVLHLVAVACGWAYNLGLKSTWHSWLPYAIAFGALPGVTTLALPGHPAPATWAVAAGVLLGVTAHLTNVLPDLDDDRRTGVAGLPHRIGARASLVLACLGVLAGTAAVVLGPPGDPSPVRWVGLAIACAWALVGTVAGLRHTDAAWVFAGTVAIAALNVVLLITGPSFVR